MRSAISRLVRRDLPEPVDPDVLDRLESLNHATSLMKTAVKQLTLPMDEKPRLLFLSVDLGRLVEAGCDQYEPLVAAKGIREQEASTGGEISTGYGLAIAKDLVDALGGRIWYENGPRGGATFFVAIPLLSAKNQA